MLEWSYESFRDRMKKLWWYKVVGDFLPQWLKENDNLAPTLLKK
jgi:hypothetical protein